MELLWCPCPPTQCALTGVYCFFAWQIPKANVENILRIVLLKMFYFLF
jgi:hypothetical protein